MSSVQSSAADVDVDLRQLFASLGRNWLRILLGSLVVAGLAFAITSFVTPLYKSETRLEIADREFALYSPQRRRRGESGKSGRGSNCQPGGADLFDRRSPESGGKAGSGEAGRVR
ncbi:Wzz/FepE/Etk N-terminal domain-containing protein [Mesorhizobium sp. UC22_110]|uniref:Wzz/FepE/Etk N-terminal domain-containing protein n=1 Tax=Mesorhizobium sp. UC22_110 TaxID=3374552 RepID=UPI0037575CB2